MADKYAKVWTSILYDEWFLSLTAIERGVWLQLIIIAKQFGDSSRIFQRNFPALASTLGTDRKTLRRVAGKFHDDGKIVLHESESGAVDITIVKYDYYQQVRTPKDTKDNGDVQGKVVEKSTKNLTQPDRTRPNQTEPAQINSPATPANFKELEEQQRKEGIKLGQIALARRYKGGGEDAMRLTAMIWNQYKPYNITPKMFEWIISAKIIPNCNDVQHCLAYSRKIGDVKGEHVSEARRFISVED